MLFLRISMLYDTPATIRCDLGWIHVEARRVMNVQVTALAARCTRSNVGVFIDGKRRNDIDTTAPRDHVGPDARDNLYGGCVPAF